MRHYPFRIHAVPGEAAAQLVIEATAGHRLGRAGRHPQRRRPAGPAGPLVVPEQELQHHGGRELGRAAEAAALGVVVRLQPGHRGLAPAAAARPGPGLPPVQPPGLPPWHAPSVPP